MSNPDTAATGAHVVIVGGGFGGIACARALRNAPVRITLIDRSNHHLFQPLLYQVATAALSPSDVAEPIRSILSRQSNVDVLLGEVVAIDRGARRLQLRHRTLEYDVLVVAAGMTNDWFGKADWANLAPGLKTLDDALEIRRRVLLAWEKAEWCANPDERARLTSFVVVGGGPTGVELAGSLAEIARHTLARDFRHVDPKQARVTLIEAGPRLLPSFPEPLSAAALDQLRDIGVDVRLGERVSTIDGDGVLLGLERIPAATVLWAAGVRGVSVASSLGTLDRAGRVVVEPDLSVPGSREVFVIGDLAAFSHGGATLPGVAQVAMQQGRHAARNILADLAARARTPFRYRDLGSMATIGRSRAIAALPGLRLRGILAWLAWLFVHLMAIVVFRSRVIVLTQWAWAYATWQRSARLIRGSETDDAGW